MVKLIEPILDPETINPEIVVPILDDKKPDTVPDTVPDTLPDNLQCLYCDHPRYSKAIWLEKHIRDKHDQEQKVTFKSPDDLEDYVGALSLDKPDPDLSQALKEEVKIPLVVTKEQATSFIRTFNTFLDNIVSLLMDLDIIYYGSMTKENIKAMANAITVYIDHSGIQVTPLVFLMWNFTLIYGSITISLPKAIRKAKQELKDEIEKEKESKA